MKDANLIFDMADLQWSLYPKCTVDDARFATCARCEDLTPRE